MTGKTGCSLFEPDKRLDDVYKNIAGYIKNAFSLNYELLLQLCGDDLLTTDQEILTKIEEIEKRMERMESVLENINSILKKVEQNTYFGCYLPEEKLE
ncbi:hypothetical protein [Methanosarcina sp.]|jgi:hypothetical protein|uniref:hypothetical protein n=1 Tax=Methanosarcina sp. TaxID=2213 RepID=UPI003BB53E2F